VIYASDRTRIRVGRENTEYVNHNMHIDMYINMLVVTWQEYFSIYMWLVCKVHVTYQSERIKEYTYIYGFSFDLTVYEKSLGNITNRDSFI
jgi:hypothetical protein